VPQSLPDAPVAGFPHGRVPRTVRAEQLLDVAEALFATVGYGLTSIERIAQAAGVTRPVVYGHFGSKDGIYLACLRRARGQLEKAIFDATSSTTDPREQLELGADAYFGFVESDVARWRVLFGGGAAVSGEVAEEAMELHLATERQFAALLAAAAPGADDELVRAYAHGIGGAAHQIAEWWLRTKGIPRQTVVRWYCELCWSGMGPVVQRRGAKPA